MLTSLKLERIHLSKFLHKDLVVKRLMVDLDMVEVLEDFDDHPNKMVLFNAM